MLKWTVIAEAYGLASLSIEVTVFVHGVPASASLLLDDDADEDADDDDD